MKSHFPAAVKSAARALDTVQYVALNGPVNARAIGRATGIPESSLSYLLATLVDRGWLMQGTDRTYSCGSVLTQIAQRAPLPLQNRAVAALASLKHRTGETACFFVRQGHDIEATAVEMSEHVLRFTPERGLRLPLHSFAAGKSLLAAFDDEALTAYFAGEGRPRFTAHTLVDEADLRRDLERTRERGYALSKEEHTVGVIGISVALDDTHSLSVAIPSPRFSEELESRTAAALRNAAAEISRNFP